MSSELLFISTDNAKFKHTRTASFSIPAGYTCPGACDCLAKFDRDTRKIVDGANQEFRCFAASMEAARPNMRRSYQSNWEKLKKAGTMLAMAELIHQSMPGVYWENFRIHVGGDYYSADYFRAWCRAASWNPDRLFYGYTKSLPIWVANIKQVPPNMVLTASVGGKWDSLIAPNNLRSARVVYHPAQALALGLEIDHDDSHARSLTGGSFALLLHGMQAKGSAASAARKRLKEEGINADYSRTAK